MRTNIFYQEPSLGTSKYGKSVKPKQTPINTWFDNPKLDLRHGIRIKHPASDKKFFDSQLEKSPEPEVRTSREAVPIKSETHNSLQTKKLLLTRGILVEGSPMKSESKMKDKETIGSAGGQLSPTKYLNSKVRSENTLKVSLESVNLRSSEIDQRLAIALDYLEYVKPKRHLGLPNKRIEPRTEESSAKKVFESHLSSQQELLFNTKRDRKYRITAYRPSARGDQVFQNSATKIGNSPLGSPQKAFSQTRSGFDPMIDLKSKVDTPKIPSLKNKTGISNPMYYVLHMLLSSVLEMETTIPW